MHLSKGQICFLTSFKKTKCSAMRPCTPPPRDKPVAGHPPNTNPNAASAIGPGHRGLVRPKAYVLAAEGHRAISLVFVRAVALLKRACDALTSAPMQGNGPARPREEELDKTGVPAHHVRHCRRSARRRRDACHHGMSSRCNVTGV